MRTRFVPSRTWDYRVSSFDCFALVFRFDEKRGYILQYKIYILMAFPHLCLVSLSFRSEVANKIEM